MRHLALALGLLAAPLAAQPAPGGPAAHRLLFTPTARAIPAGEWRLGLTEVLVPNVSVGLGAGVSLGAGVVVGPAPIESGIVFVEPKVSLVDRPGLAVALGATSRIDPASGKGVDASTFPHAVATVESGRAPGSLAATLGLGARVNVRRTPLSVHYVTGSPTIDVAVRPTPGEVGLDVVPAPAVWGGLELRASDRVSILLEAAALPDRQVRFDGPPCPFCFSATPGRYGPGYGPVRYDLTGAAAVRVATRRVAFDGGLGVIRTDDGGSTPYVEPAPWVNLSVGLGRR